MHSQNEEEKYILEICEGVTARFLDIGAWNAETFSNTRALFELGWGGILIEPSPGPVKELAKAYRNFERVQVIATAITVEGGPLTLAVTDDAVTGAADGPTVTKWWQSGGYYGKITVPSLSMRSFFEKWGGEFEMISIDTEGSSVDLFAEMIQIGPRPRCVVVEHDSRFVELSAWAQKGNYQMVYENGENRVYQWTGKRGA